MGEFGAILLGLFMGTVVGVGLIISIVTGNWKQLLFRLSRGIGTLVVLTALLTVISLTPYGRQIIVRHHEPTTDSKSKPIDTWRAGAELNEIQTEQFVTNRVADVHETGLSRQDVVNNKSPQATNVSPVNVIAVIESTIREFAVSVRRGIMAFDPQQLGFESVAVQWPTSEGSKRGRFERRPSVSDLENGYGVAIPAIFRDPTISTTLTYEVEEKQNRRPLWTTPKVIQKLPTDRTPPSERHSERNDLNPSSGNDPNPLPDQTELESSALDSADEP
ncbi:MAG: hypothetical protein H7062_04855 [Candidatus Saccharimonas sp.]|nr:hypothetical protein [Planctomycetaceae bacterium]